MVSKTLRLALLVHTLAASCHGIAPRISFAAPVTAPSTTKTARLCAALHLCPCRSLTFRFRTATSLFRLGPSRTSALGWTRGGSEASKRSDVYAVEWQAQGGYLVWSRLTRCRAF